MKMCITIPYLNTLRYISGHNISENKFKNCIFHQFILYNKLSVLECQKDKSFITSRKLKPLSSVLKKKLAGNN